MALKAAFNGGVQALFEAFDDIPFDITYKVYTADSGGGTLGIPTGSFSAGDEVQAFVLAYKNQEVFNSGGLIAPGDRKVIIEKRVLDALSITVKKSDQLVIEGDTYKIINSFPDPSKSIFTIQVRQVA